MISALTIYDNYKLRNPSLRSFLQLSGVQAKDFWLHDNESTGLTEGKKKCHELMDCCLLQEFALCCLLTVFTQQTKSEIDVGTKMDFGTLVSLLN
jgi:hypothetical protein